MEPINEVIQVANADSTVIGLAATARASRWPSSSGACRRRSADEADREAYIGDINETVKQYYGRAGLQSLVDFLNFEEDKLYDHRPVMQAPWRS